MIGKKPVMNRPYFSRSSVALKKQFRSPAVLPVAVGHCGVWNHTNELMMWCRPNGMSRRLAMP